MPTAICGLDAMSFMQMRGRRDDHSIDGCVDLGHCAISRPVQFERRIRINKSGILASLMRTHGLNMTNADQATADNEDAFHITAPICQGTNS
jgi:hypothetical protein